MGRGLKSYVRHDGGIYTGVVNSGVLHTGKAILTVGVMGMSECVRWQGFLHWDCQFRRSTYGRGNLTVVGMGISGLYSFGVVGYLVAIVQ